MISKRFSILQNRASGPLLRTRGRNYLIVGESPARKTLVTPRVWRIMPVGERKVESLAASDFDAGFCPHSLARVASAQFQRLLCPGVLRGSLFSKATGVVPSARDHAAD